MGFGVILVTYNCITLNILKQYILASNKKIRPKLNYQQIHQATLLFLQLTGYPQDVHLHKC